MSTHNIQYHDETKKKKKKSLNIFFLSNQKNILWVSLEVPRRGASKEYPQHVFS